MDDLMSKPFMKDGKLLSFDEEGNAETKLAVLKKGAGDMARQLANVVRGLFGFDGDIKDLFDVNIKQFHPTVDNARSSSVGAESAEYIIEKQISTSST